MEGATGINSPSPITMTRKPRSTASRRPRSTENLTTDPSIHISQSGHNDNANPSRRKELFLNNLPPSSSSKKSKREDRSRNGGSSSHLARSTEGVLSPVNWRGSASGAHQDGIGGSSSSVENKLRKVKLKVGGVTRTIHAKSEVENKAKGDYWFSNAPKVETHDKSNNASPSDPVRKSRRVSKKRALDSELDEANGDNESRYLEKLKISSRSSAADQAARFEDTVDESVKKRKLSKIPNKSNSRNAPYELDEDFVVSRRDSGNRRRLRMERESETSGFIEDEEPGSEEMKRQSEPALTTRQRALQSGRGNGDTLIEFPNGLPPAPSRKKEKLSEVEIQAKKAEAAQRRKMQVEKAAKEAEAEAIRKILGLDSDKKKEEKKQKEREEKEKLAKSQIQASNMIRWVMGPTGTVVTFPDEVGLPTMFNSKPSSYPPERERCAGPSCTNPYKYRDSKSNLPLCSLHCYKAVQGSSQALTC